MKIDIISGFLGSGKTTLIRKLLKEAYSDEKVVLIENEFGEIGIDGGFLKDAGIEITEMNSGCICCSLVGDFAKALKQVTERFKPDRIIIEPSGVGKLSDVARAVEKGLENVKVNSKTTVVNAKKCRMYAKNFGEFFFNQVENADCVVLSHTDMTDKSTVEDCLAFIKEHNRDAIIVSTEISLLDGKDILAAMEKKSSDASSMARELLHEEQDEKHGEEEHCRHHNDDDDDDEHEEEGHCCHHHHHDEDEYEEEEGHCCHHHDGHDADEVFSSWGKETTRSYTIDEMRGILAKLADEKTYGIILRAKGIVEGDGYWINFDYIPDGVDVRKGNADIIGKLCVIGSKLNENALAKLFGI